MNVILAKIIWQLGSQLRNPHFRFHYRELKKSEEFSLNTLEELQFTRAKQVLIHAYTYSPYYRKTFSANFFNPITDFNSLGDLKKIPVISKAELIKFNDQIHALNFNERVFLSETSGSTGQSLNFRKDENWDSFNRAARARGFSWYGVNAWDRNGYLWGYNFAPFQQIKTCFLDRLQNQFRIFSYKDKEINKFAARLKNAVYLNGYSSMIHEVARRINAQPDLPKPMKLKMICGTSEKIYDTYQKDSIKAFGRKIIGEYGAAEAGIIGFECPHGNLHINMEGGIVEEENGEIIVTNLVARSFPVIRYKLGDYIKLAPDDYQCSCGMKHKVIESVLGRVGKLVQGISNTYPSLVFYYIFKNLAVYHSLELNYQVVQEKAGELTIRIEQAPVSSEINFLEKELTKYFKKDMNWNILTGQKLHDQKGKFIDFISNI